MAKFVIHLVLLSFIRLKKIHVPVAKCSEGVNPGFILKRCLTDQAVTDTALNGTTLKQKKARTLGKRKVILHKSSVIRTFFWEK